MAPSSHLEQQQLAERVRVAAHLTDPRIVQAFAAVPRHEFLSGEQRAIAYEDRALSLSEGQTVSQPSMIALMLAALDCKASDRALEVGAGSGYAAALLGQLVREVYAIELRPALAELARKNLKRAGTTNVEVVLGDGTEGLVRHAPYDRILVSAAPQQVPAALIEQLAVTGKLAIPVGDNRSQSLLVGEKAETEQMHWQRSVSCSFVPLVVGG